jgi:hypothetical protein
MRVNYLAAWPVKMSFNKDKLIDIAALTSEIINKNDTRIYCWVCGNGAFFVFSKTIRCVRCCTYYALFPHALEFTDIVQERKNRIYCECKWGTVFQLKGNRIKCSQCHKVQLFRLIESLSMIIEEGYMSILIADKIIDGDGHPTFYIQNKKNPGVLKSSYRTNFLNSWKKESVINERQKRISKDW